MTVAGGYLLGNGPMSPVFGKNVHLGDVPIIIAFFDYEPRVRVFLDYQLDVLVSHFADLRDETVSAAGESFDVLITVLPLPKSLPEFMNMM